MQTLGLTRSKLETPDGATISYWIRPGERHFVLLHGLGYSAAMWRDTIAALPAEHGIVALDLRGHGETTIGTAPPSVNRWAADVLAVLDSEAIESPAVCGLSMGGYTAFALAAAAPERFRGFGFVSTAASADDVAARANRAAGIQTLRTAGVDAYCEALLSKLLWPDHPDYETHASQARSAFRVAGAIGLAYALLALAARPSRIPLLGSISQPTRVVVGDRDILTPVERARQIADGLPNSELHVIADAAHMSAVEQPRRVAEAIAVL